MFFSISINFFRQESGSFCHLYFSLLSKKRLALAENRIVSKWERGGLSSAVVRNRQNILLRNRYLYHALLFTNYEYHHDRHFFPILLIPIFIYPMGGTGEWRRRWLRSVSARPSVPPREPNPAHHRIRYSLLVTDSFCDIN